MIYAQSLAPLIELADNPPVYYRTHLPDFSQPLTLYIARVPGSRDVFLTTVKPLDKVVRAEDVESCLYYVHVDSEKDEELLLCGDIVHPTENGAPTQSNIVERVDAPTVKRKPLRPQSAIISSKRQESSSDLSPLPMSLSSTDAPSRKPVLGHQNAQPHPKARLHGPRPMAQHAAFANAAISSTRGLPLYDENAPPSAYQTYSTKDGIPFGFGEDPSPAFETKSDFRIDERPVSYASGCSSSRIAPLGKRASSLTLIRRYGGQQSNVSRIDEDRQLQIFSSGYGKVSKGHPAQTNDDSFEQENRGTSKLPFKSQIVPMKAPNSTQSHDTTMGITRLVEARRHSFGLRKQSQDLIERPDIHPLAAEKKTGCKGHEYSTPWGTVCRLATERGSRSIKCTHIPQNAAGHSSLSELRFNLPQSQAGQAHARNAKRDRAHGSRSSIVFGTGKRRSVDEAIDNDPTLPAAVPENQDAGPMDLSLGQERAGGGFGGKKAKLGKLIIEPEGFQMLDLLVAANISMWWRVYNAPS